MKNVFVEDFESELFTTAFKKYFNEVSGSERNWVMLFRQMNAEKDTTKAIMAIEGESVIGFVMFCEIELKCVFFSEKLGYIRELWVDPQYRHSENGRMLLKLSEDYFHERNIKKSVLCAISGTENFYVKNGYKESPSIDSGSKRFFMKELKR